MVARPTASDDDPRRRGARTKVERTRSALLTAASTVFSEKGWIAARVEDIAREAGVSAATAYNHFQTKHALIGHAFGPLIGPTIDRAQLRIATGDPMADVLETHIRELARVTRAHQRLTTPFIDAVQDYTIKVGGPPDPADRNDPRTLAPFPVAVTNAIASGQHSGLFRRYPPARDLGPNITNLLLLRTITRPDEDPADTAEFVLTIMFGALTPQLLVDVGVDGRPFSKGHKSQRGDVPGKR